MAGLFFGVGAAHSIDDFLVKHSFICTAHLWVVGTLNLLLITNYILSDIIYRRSFHLRLSFIQPQPGPGGLLAAGGDACHFLFTANSRYLLDSFNVNKKRVQQGQKGPAGNTGLQLLHWALLCPSVGFERTKHNAKQSKSTKPNQTSTMADADTERDQILSQYRAKIREHRETEARLKRIRLDVKDLVARYQKTEDDLTALQSVGQIIGDVLKRLDDDRFIVKASSGPRYVVGCRSRLNRNKLKAGTRVALDMTTLTIMRILPREVDPTVFHMQSTEDEGEKKTSFADIGGLNEQ